ncbi:hypothetical protein GGI12_000992 [Dipsacomyces acuminosporus]|nr:hypothetical protein GGI12_000992 [Dipsacomyces acuminosporus]
MPETSQSIYIRDIEAGSPPLPTQPYQHQQTPSPPPSISDKKPTARSKQHVRQSRSFGGLGNTQRDAPVSGHTQHERAHKMDKQNTPPNNARAKSNRLPASDGKYNTISTAAMASHTSAKGERRARQQRRRTDGTDDLRPIKRPSTAHSSTSPQHAATYSQYPDFENIKDPFAKRDKIPMASTVNKPATARPGKEDNQENSNGGNGGNKGEGSPDADATNEHGNGSRSAPQTPATAFRQKPALQHDASRDAPAPRFLLHGYPGDDQVVPASADSEQYVGPKLANAGALCGYDAQEGVPTPLKKRDKIPMYSDQYSSFSQPSKLQGGVQMEAMAVHMPNPPARLASGQTPTSAMPMPTTRNWYGAEDGSLAAGGQTRRPSRHRSERKQPAAKPIDIPADARAPARSFAGHTNSPRLEIDMDKVDTLYARQSLIFEKNKRSSSSNNRASTASDRKSNAGSAVPAPAPANAAKPAAAAKRKSGARYYSPISEGTETFDDDEDGNEDRVIPFDQVLIPTAFKRLRVQLEDPSFEIDEETYRRFKLSELWYAREERLQLERAFNTGTFGKSKNRGRVVRPALSDTSASDGAEATIFDYAGEDVPNEPAANDGHDEGHVPRRSDEHSSSKQQHHRQQLRSTGAMPERKRTSARQKHTAMPNSGSSSNDHGADRQSRGNAERVPGEAHNARASHRHAGAPRGFDSPDDKAFSAPVPPNPPTADYSSQFVRLGVHDQHQGQQRQQHRSKDPTEQASSGCCACIIM